MHRLKIKIDKDTKDWIVFFVLAALGISAAWIVTGLIIVFFTRLIT